MTQLAGLNSNYSSLIPEGVDPTMAWLFTQSQEEARKRNDPQRIKEQIDILEPMFQRRAEQQMKYGMMSNLFGSILKDIPAAIKNYAYAGREYDPTLIQIAGRSRIPDYIPPVPTASPRNYFGFVR